MVSASGGVKFEPQMMGIPEASSSHDDEDDEEIGIDRSSSDDDDDDDEDETMDDEGDLRYLPREQQQRRRQDQDGSFPSIPTFPAVLPQGDGSFPRMDDLARVGPLPTMFEGGSSAASSVTGSDRGGATSMSADTLPDSEKHYNDAATASPTSSAQTLGLGLDNDAHHAKSRSCCAPSMRCLKVAMSIALALLVLCIILIAVTILGQGRDDGVASAQNKGPGLDVIVNLPTAAPTHVPTPPTWNTEDTAKPASPMLAPTTAPTTTKTTTTAAPSLSPTMAPTARPFATPTLFPTNGATTASPTASPSIAPTGAPCADDLTVNFDINGISRNCDWLANSTFYQTLLCNPYNYMASTICPVTCQLCDVVAATNNTTMEDVGGA